VYVALGTVSSHRHQLQSVPTDDLADCKLNSRLVGWGLTAQFRSYRAFKVELYYKQGVALTGRNTIGPPRAAPGELRCDAAERYRRRQTTTTDVSDRY